MCMLPPCDPQLAFSPGSLQGCSLTPPFLWSFTGWSKWHQRAVFLSRQLQLQGRDHASRPPPSFFRQKSSVSGVWTGCSSTIKQFSKDTTCCSVTPETTVSWFSCPVLLRIRGLIYMMLVQLFFFLFQPWQSGRKGQWSHAVPPLKLSGFLGDKEELDVPTLWPWHHQFPSITKGRSWQLHTTVYETLHVCVACVAQSIFTHCLVLFSVGFLALSHVLYVFCTVLLCWQFTSHKFPVLVQSVKTQSQKWMNPHWQEN